MPAHTPRLKPHSLALALAALLPSVAFAAGQDTAHRDRHLTELSSVQVTASPLQGDAESLARPVEVLAGERLDEQKAGTLGDTVAKLPGVQSTFFGPGVGRPIIRGQEGPRVAVLSNGMGNMDAGQFAAVLLLEVGQGQFALYRHGVGHQPSAWAQAGPAVR